MMRNQYPMSERFGQHCVRPRPSRGPAPTSTGAKNGTPSTHPLMGDELRALGRLQRESETSPFVFVSERGSPFTTAGFARMVERAAGAAGLELNAHPHMLRHACGYALANRGHDTRAIQGTGRSPARRSIRRRHRNGSGA